MGDGFRRVVRALRGTSELAKLLDGGATVVAYRGNDGSYVAAVLPAGSEVGDKVGDLVDDALPIAEDVACESGVYIASSFDGPLFAVIDVARKEPPRRANDEGLSD